MSTVLTLISDTRNQADLARLAAAIAETLATPADLIWLAPGEACDVVFDAVDTERIEQAARIAARDIAVDIFVQPTENRRKRLLVADMEATIIENEMLDELADFIGLRPQVSEITRRAMNGEIDFAAALAARVQLLQGMEERVLDAAAERIRVMPGAPQLVATMRAGGARTALVSGGFTIFAERVAAELGFDHMVANRLDLAAGRIAGTVQSPIVTRDTKRQILLDLAAEHGIPLGAAMAVGDGANDLPMLAAAGIGVAFHAQPAVAAAARWRVDHANLTALLYAQGYRLDEIAS